MQKLKKKSRRLLRLVVIAAILIFLPSVFLNFTYGLQYSRDKNNEFIGTHNETTNIPTEIPPTVPATTTNRPTESQPPTYPPTVPATTDRTSQPPTIPANTQEPTRIPGNYSPTEPTLSENYNPTDETEHTDGNVVPGGSHPVVTEPSDNTDYEYTTGKPTVPVEHTGGNTEPKSQNGNITHTTGGEKSNPPAGSSPKTGDEETDPRLWLTILAVSAFILRYLLFFREKTESDNKL